jgi:hypothetical protein
MAETPSCDDGEVSRIARDLSAKYGPDAIAFATSRAERAAEIGDQLACDIWQKVLRTVSGLTPHHR